ncbi:Peroxisomal acyl-coenzyme A oxidase 2 [Ophiophagus hannah]|uniref:Peroxisomal acyl-coenzyme A oxidase 2 n=1 Tax=Ophiophagus hannah TaxID=8665 RepID=V8NNB1_OPHHA|nr:Peroxisomal acyl-coenzyme A oxidase 2 [Ophiophagus hannah]
MEAKKANIFSPNSPGQNVNPDLDIERKNISFSIEHLTNILDGGANNTKLRREVEAVLEADPEFSQENRYFQSQNERYESAVRKTVYLLQKMAKMGWIDDGPEQNYCFKFLTDDLAFTIHIIFMKSILALGTDEQINKWIPLAKKIFIIGTYAQTELGHGSNLRGLETTATFDAATQEFILNTPTFSAMKWWPGDLGRTATHAVVFAQLYLKGSCYGMHPFIVQIRSLRDHSPGQGITLGDIGPKMGFENIDNGFLILKNVRVPRENMLAKFSQVLPDGQYKKQGSEKINYLTMVVVRVNMLQSSIIPCLMKACTIAIRYSVVRRQSELKPGDPEAKILDYQTQQQKLFPQLATAYAFHFICNYLQEIFHRCYNQTQEGKFDLLPEVIFIRNAAMKLQQLVQAGKTQHEAWNQCTVQLTRAAMVHSHYIVVQKFTEELRKHAKESATRRVLKNLCDLFALHGIFSNAGDFMQDAYFSTEQIDRVTETYLDLLAVIR